MSNFSSASDSTFRVRMTQFFPSVHWAKKLSHFDLKSWVTWVELRQKHLNWKNIYCIGYPTSNGQSSIIAKVVNKQNTSKLLRYKKYFKMILKMILKWFDFQCDFDFQITAFKMIWILILNHLYLGDLILILKSSTYDDFAHLCSHVSILKKFLDYFQIMK